MKPLLLFAFLVATASPAMTVSEWCLQKPRSETYERFAARLVGVGSPPGSDSPDFCRGVETTARRKERVSAVLPADEALLSLFPALKSVFLEAPEPLARVDVAFPPTLEHGELRGKLRLESLGRLHEATGLRSLELHGEGAGAWVDAREIAKAAGLTQLRLTGVRVRHAKALEKLKELAYLELRAAPLDEAIEWARLPKLRRRIVH